MESVLWATSKSMPFIPLEDAMFDIGFASPEATGYSIGLAQSADLLAATSKLVFSQYLKKGFASEEGDGHWLTAHDFLTGTTTYAVKDPSGQVCFTVTAVLDDSLGLPCEDIFSDEISRLRESGRRMTEVISLASNLRNPRLANYSLIGQLRLMTLRAKYVLGQTNLVMTVNPRHVDFYRKKLLFSPLSEPRSFEKVNGAPAVLMHLDLELAPARALECFGCDASSTYVHFLQPNRRQSDLLKWLNRYHEPRTAASLSGFKKYEAVSPRSKSTASSRDFASTC